MEYLLHMVVILGIYATLAVSLDLLVGRTGLLSVTHGALFGLGAYTSALLAVLAGIPFLGSLGLSMLFTAGIGLLLGVVVLRLRNDEFVMVTFAFQVVLVSIFNNSMSLTHGPLGITGISRPVIFGWEVRTNLEFAILVGAFAILAYIVVGLIVTSPFGRILHAIREDEVFAKACGKSTVRYKAIALATSSALAAMAGALYAHYVSYIDPTSFTVMESILVLSMVIIGGAGSMWGPLVGAVVLVSLPEALRFVGLPTSAAANLRQIIYGALLVVMMMARPQGLVGRYAFGR